MIPNRSRRIAGINIGLCWPELTAHEQRRLLRSHLIETGKTIIETSALWLRHGNSSLRLIKQVDGNHLIEEAMAQGAGVILVTPHLGAWEAAGLYGASTFKITCLYRPLKMPGLEQLVHTARSRFGGNYVPATAHGIRILYKKLAQGKAVALLPDQEPQAGTGVFAPFFGIPAYSMVLLARLAAKNSTPMIFAWCERLSWGRGYHLHITAIPDVARADGLEATVVAINKALEECVRECPAQYQWSYQRFRIRPPGEASFYKPASVAKKPG